MKYKLDDISKYVKPNHWAYVIDRDGKEVFRMTAPRRELCVSFAMTNADDIERDCRYGRVLPHGTSVAIVEIDRIKDGGREFEIVNEWPRGGYVVWNIGRHNFEHEGYIPLAQVNADYTINPVTLKALYVGNEDLCLAVLREAGHHGVDEAKFNKMKAE